MTKIYAAIIPVAGLSSRMGSFKPLLKIKGFSMIELTVQSVVKGGVRRTCVVTGRDAQKIEDILQRSLCGSSTQAEREESSVSTVPSVFCTYNPEYARSDMLQSIKLGLRALLDEGDSDCMAPPEALFIIPGDMPGVHPETFALLKKASENEKQYSVFVPTYLGRRGHPLLISNGCYDAVLGFEGEGGLKQALSGFDWCEVPTTDPGIRLDADTPEDFDALQAHMNARSEF